MVKGRLIYITVASLIVLTTIFAGVHAITTKNTDNHTPTMVTRRRQQSFSQLVWGRRPKETNLAISTFDDKDGENHQQWIGSLAKILANNWLLSSMPIRAPPELSAS